MYKCVRYWPFNIYVCIRKYKNAKKYTFPYYKVWSSGKHQRHYEQTKTNIATERRNITIAMSLGTTSYLQMIDSNRQHECVKICNVSSK